MQRFRLWTEAPIYIDFKAPPYAADEVFEWKRRLKECEKWYAQRDWDSPEIWREVKLAADRQHRVANALGIQPAAVGPPAQAVFGIDRE